jgi:serine/threonine-protein kinase
LQLVINQEPVPPTRLIRTVPRDVETICLKCLEKAPRSRYPSAAALAEDLHRFERGDPIAARPLHSLQRYARWMRRNPSQGALIVAVLALLAVGLGVALWQGRQRAQRIAEQARMEGRASQALDTALEHAVAFRSQGRWPEVRAELQGAARLLELSSSAGVRKRMQEALADADMVVELENIRLRLSEGGNGQEQPAFSPDQAYAVALGKYGIVLTAPDLEKTVARIRNSAIRETLLAFLHDWLYWVSDANREKLRALLDRVDDDEWRRDFRQAYLAKDNERLRWLSRADQAVTQPTVVLSGLAGSLVGGQYKLEALTLLQGAQQRHPDDFWLNYLLGKHWYAERSQEAIGYCRAAVAIRPGSDQAYVLLGNVMHDRGDMAGAKAAYRKVLALNPNCVVAKDLASAEDSQSGLEEARIVWERLLEHDPRNHSAWYGYAELCLYLDNREAYFQARKRLLQIFGETLNDWIVAERTSTACLLLPASGDELLRAGIVAEVAVMSAAKNPDAGNPYVMFARGLADYRQGRYERAITLLPIVAAKLSNRPASRLVLAMAQFESGLINDARKTMAAAIRSYNWNESSPAFRKDAVTSWTNHILRRQAEELILPNLQEFRREEYQPQDNDERMALLGVCHFERRYVAAARLYVEAFAAEPHLADELTAECLTRISAPEHPDNPIEVFNAACRYQAACCAAQAGQGLGKDGDKLSLTELMRWRRQAREWLQDDLVAWIKKLNSESQTIRDLAQRMLEYWQVDPRLAGLRDASLLETLSADEQKECLLLWNQVASGLKRKKTS